MNTNNGLPLKGCMQLAKNNARLSQACHNLEDCIMLQGLKISIWEGRD